VAAQYLKWQELTAFEHQLRVLSTGEVDAAWEVS
jgi:hypothetical protein